MIVIGIDPSINHTGVAVVECERGNTSIRELMLIKTREKDILRLPELYEGIDFIMPHTRDRIDKTYVVIERPLKYTRKTYSGKSQNVKSVVELNNAFSIIYLAVFHRFQNANGIFDKDRIKTPYAPSGYGKNKRGLPTKENARYILQAHFTDLKDIKRVKTADLNCIDALMLAVWGCQEGGNDEHK